MKQYYISSNKYSTFERKTKKGTVYDIYFYVTTLDGVKKQIKKGGFSTKTYARQWYLEFVTEYCELAKVLPFSKNDKKEEFTVAQLFPLYIQAISNQNKESVIYERQNTFTNLILPRLGNYTLKQLTTEELYKWQDEVWARRNPATNEFYSYNYSTKIRTMMSAFLTWCETRYGYPNNLLKVKKPKRRSPQRQMQIWTREDFNRFISAIQTDIDKFSKELLTAPKTEIKGLQAQANRLINYKMFFTIAFYTGRRKGEILALSNDSVKTDSIKFDKSLTRKTLTEDTYKITSTKTEKQESTPICPALAKELANFKGQTPFFISGKEPLSDTSLTRVFNKYTELAGNKPIRVHDLRHSFISMMISEFGAPLTVCANLIGDTLTQVTKTYAHLYESDKYFYLNKLK